MPSRDEEEEEEEERQAQEETSSPGDVNRTEHNNLQSLDSTVAFSSTSVFNRLYTLVVWFIRYHVMCSTMEGAAEGESFFCGNIRERCSLANSCIN